ncbi:MAG: phosphatidylglycerophosphatase A [Kiritimatiellia bacterium]
MDSKRTFWDKVNLFVATGFGIGLVVPFAPGTFGSAAGVALAYATTLLPVWAQVVACLGLTLAAISFCGSAERMLGIKDDGRITADEWMLYPLALIGIPVGDLPWYAMAAFFLVIRAIDIVKPPPARQLQAIHGGFGIVIDDFFANLYSLGLNWALYVYLFK